MRLDGSGLEQAGAILVRLTGIEVVASAEVGGEIELVVQTDARPVGWSLCAVAAVGKGRRDTLVGDFLRVGDRPC